MTKKMDTVKPLHIHVTSPRDSKGATSTVGHNYFANGVLVHNEKAVGGVCAAVGLDENSVTNDCDYSQPINGPAVDCCQNNGGTVDINPSYPRGAYCQAVNNCDGFNTCPNNGAQSCTDSMCTISSSACSTRGGGVSYGTGCKCNDGTITSCPLANL